MHSADELVICLVDFNGHMGRNIDAIRGGYCGGQKNLEGKMLSQLALKKKFIDFKCYFYRYIYIYIIVTTKEFSENKVLNIVNVEL